jgi:hypothetical protein
MKNVKETYPRDDAIFLFVIFGQKTIRKNSNLIEKGGGKIELMEI